jgi:hypothetical protein
MEKHISDDIAIRRAFVTVIHLHSGKHSVYVLIEPAKARGVRFTALITACPACPIDVRPSLGGGWVSGKQISQSGAAGGVSLCFRGQQFLTVPSEYGHHLLYDDWFEDTVLVSLTRRNIYIPSSTIGQRIRRQKADSLTQLLWQ